MTQPEQGIVEAMAATTIKDSQEADWALFTHVKDLFNNGELDACLEECLSLINKPDLDMEVRCNTYVWLASCSPAGCGIEYVKLALETCGKMTDSQNAEAYKSILEEELKELRMEEKGHQANESGANIERDLGGGGGGMPGRVGGNIRPATSGGMSLGSLAIRTRPFPSKMTPERSSRGECQYDSSKPRQQQAAKSEEGGI